MEQNIAAWIFMHSLKLYFFNKDITDVSAFNLKTNFKSWNS